MNEVSKLIYNALIKYQAVYLPDVGTLCVVRHSATMSSKNELIQPRYEIEYTSENRARSIVNIISAEVGVDAKRAEEIYSRWIDKAREGSNIKIDRVGTLSGNSFVADKVLIKALNICEQTLRITRRRNFTPLIASVATIVILSAMAGGGWWYFTTKPAAVPIEIVAEEAAKPLVEIAIVDNEQQTEEEDVVPIENDTTDVDIDWRTRDNIRHWVVVGSYSTIDNAERAISNIIKRMPEAQCDYFKLGSMYAVAVYGSTDLEECQQFKTQHKQDFTESWVYTPKRFR